MCQAILQGLRQYLDNTGRRTKGANAVLPTEALEEEHLEEACCGLLSMTLEEQGFGDVVDATTGQILRGELVRQVRELEMQYFRHKDVYSKRPRAEAYQRTREPPIIIK